MSALGSKLRSVQDGGVMFWCPGCDSAHVVWVGEGRGPRWSFNGDGDRPTFTPSVLVRGETWTPPVNAENIDEWRRKPWPQTKVASVCHSFVTDGRIQFLGDSTHALAGKTVDLPDFDEAPK